MLPTPAMNQSKRELSQYGWRPADPARWPVLFVNPGSGDGKAAHARVAEWARDKGIEAVILAPGQDLAALAGEAVAAGADALGMAGGDGSLAVVAASTPELTVRRCNSARRCGSLSGRRRCRSGSPRATRAPRQQRACASQATTPISEQERIGARNQQGSAPIGIRLQPENPQVPTVLRRRC